MKDQQQTRFIAAIKYIYTHIDESITLDEVANSSHCSVSTLKRLFIDITGESPARFIRRLRMELAFNQLNTKEDKVLFSALASGFENHAAFSRAFKKCFGYTPSEAREKHNIVSELESVTLEDPEIVVTKDIAVQVSTESGTYFEAAPKAWENLASALSKSDTNEDATCLFFGIGHDDPHKGEVKPDSVRFSAGISMATENASLQPFSILGGRYAKFNYTGKPMNLGLAYHYIYGKWDTDDCIDHEKVAFTVIDHLLESGIQEESLQIWIPILG